MSLLHLFYKFTIVYFYVPSLFIIFSVVNYTCAILQSLSVSQMCKVFQLYKIDPCHDIQVVDFDLFAPKPNYMTQLIHF